ncbi:hypothetical protein [Meiothermus cerbereus]|uniref:hypothetical protein n=1 Tax=Meiothermus cerbereus TaxID=65552 RepID=UPI003EEBD08E
MGLDDLLGLLFLFFFIVLPALQGLLRRGQQMPPDFEPDEIPLPGEERRPPPRPSSTQPPGAPARPAAPPPPPASTPPARPLVSQSAQPPKPRTPPAKRPRSLEEVERERLARSSARLPKESPQPTPGKAQPESRGRTAEHWAFSTSTRDILNGVVWHQVLAEPRSQYWRRARKSRR